MSKPIDENTFNDEQDLILLCSRSSGGTGDFHGTRCLV
jgi:hypothetical protein